MSTNKKTGKKNGNSEYRNKDGVGKGDRHRTTKQNKYANGHAAIDWGRNNEAEAIIAGQRKKFEQFMKGQ